MWPPPLSWGSYFSRFSTFKDDELSVAFAPSVVHNLYYVVLWLYPFNFVEATNVFVVINVRSKKNCARIVLREIEFRVKLYIAKVILLPCRNSGTHYFTVKQERNSSTHYFTVKQEKTYFCLN